MAKSESKIDLKLYIFSIFYSSFISSFINSFLFAQSSIKILNIGSFLKAFEKIYKRADQNTFGEILIGRVGMPFAVEGAFTLVSVPVGDGGAKADLVIFPLEAINFCIRPFWGARIAPGYPADRLVVEKLLMRRVEDVAGEVVKEGGWL